jgi:hypothetical protein
MHKIIGIAVLSLLVLGPAAVTAQTATVRQACKADLEQHCAGVQPGTGQLRACVKEHFTAFSEPCKAALLSSVAVVKACKADAQKTCAGIEPGGGRIQACMKDHFAEFSESCQQAIITAKVGRR